MKGSLMMIQAWQPVILAAISCSILTGTTCAQEPTSSAKFKAPKRIMAGSDFLGQSRLYPSPAMHDIDGDQRPDIVIGDLFGRPKFASRTQSNGAPEYAAEVGIKNDQGKLLKFHNW